MESVRAIPRIIHQTWRTRDIPERWQRLQRTWLEMHPHWEYRFWTDADNRELIRIRFPSFLATYDAYPHPVNRADVVRYFLMAEYGGVYLDLDFECLRPLDTVFAGQQVVLGVEPEAHAASEPVRARGLTQVVCNAFIASAPGHPFWQHVTDGLLDSCSAPGVLDATGTFFLSRAYNSYPDRPAITLLPANRMYPFSNRETHGPLTAQQLREQVSPEAYAIHYWHGSWWREATLRAVHRRLRTTRSSQ